MTQPTRITVPLDLEVTTIEFQARSLDVSDCDYVNWVEAAFIP